MKVTNELIWPMLEIIWYVNQISICKNKIEQIDYPGWEMFSLNSLNIGFWEEIFGEDREFCCNSDLSGSELIS